MKNEKKSSNVFSLLQIALDRLFTNFVTVKVTQAAVTV